MQAQPYPPSPALHEHLIPEMPGHHLALFPLWFKIPPTEASKWLCPWPDNGHSGPSLFPLDSGIGSHLALSRLLDDQLQEGRESTSPGPSVGATTRTLPDKQNIFDECVD